MVDPLKVIDHIYEAATNPEHWAAALKHIIDWVGAEDAGLDVAIGNEIPWLVAPMTDPGLLKLYPHCALHDIVRHNFISRGPGGALADMSVIEPDELKHNAFQQEWCAPLGYHHRFGAVLFDDEQSRTVLMLPNRHSIEQEQLDRLDTMLPHLRRALQLSFSFASNGGYKGLTETLFETSERPMIVMDCTGKILASSPATESWFAHNPAIISELADRTRFLIQNPTAANTLLFTSRRAARIRSIPLRAPSLPPVAGCPAILFYESAPTNVERLELLRSQYGLTQAEALLAIEICRGDGRRAAAQRRGISDTTARTHLSHIFDKMGLSRQAELVRVIGQLN